MYRSYSSCLFPSRNLAANVHVQQKKISIGLFPYFPRVHQYREESVDISSLAEIPKALCWYFLVDIVRQHSVDISDSTLLIMSINEILHSIHKVSSQSIANEILSLYAILAKRAERLARMSRKWCCFSRMSRKYIWWIRLLRLSAYNLPVCFSSLHTTQGANRVRPTWTKQSSDIPFACALSDCRQLGNSNLRDNSRSCT